MLWAAVYIILYNMLTHALAGTSVSCLQIIVRLAGRQ